MKKILTLFAFALVAFTANAQSTLMGDVNGDGSVTVTDVSMMVAYILGQQSDDFIEANADANGDGIITVTDVAETVNTILDGNDGNDGNGDTPQTYFTCPDSHHPHMIDLGIGTLWSCCNVGANTPDDYGGYYAWGETTEKDNYTFETYQHKYLDNDGVWHHKMLGDICMTLYDVAFTTWGGGWRLPTSEEAITLAEKCQREDVTVNDVMGMKFTGPNGNSIFLPFNGYMSNQRENWSKETLGYYRTGTVNHDIWEEPPYFLNIRWYHAEASLDINYWQIELGMSARPVIGLP